MTDKKPDGDNTRDLKVRLFSFFSQNLMSPSLSLYLSYYHFLLWPIQLLKEVERQQNSEKFSNNLWCY